MHFRLLRLLEQRPEISQRELAEEVGVALGKVNYVLNALTKKGLVKIRNFRNSEKKLRYAYILTPAGLSAKADLTAGFLNRKIAEYEALRAEIESLQGETGWRADTAISPTQVALKSEASTRRV
ncbi:MarR family EPS-associated transcriptional regulator [Cereibacter changlensis]|uniref:MarR family EPS-associated transcriptional regulator n=1 Tax=Cereibacter changlensis TaxID=402884 RepID=UPI001FE46B46|nr:MarR family EPS-associated transcriptional regulator [Cereibacter changlensis]